MLRKPNVITNGRTTDIQTINNGRSHQLRLHRGSEYFRGEQGEYIGVLGKNTAGKASHIYQYKLQDPNAERLVVVTDRFGNEYTETEFTSSLTTAGTY